MAQCTVYIRIDLMGKAPTGGTWTYNGYSASSPVGPFNATPAIPLVPVSAATELTGWGDDFLLNYEGKTPGYYSFTYDYVGGSDDLTLNLEDKTQCAGVSKTIVVSASDNTPLDLDSQLAGSGCPSPTGGGRWVDTDSAGAAFVTATGVLTPSSLAAPGTYRFTYTLVPVGFETIVCNCSSLEAVITVIATADIIASISSASDTCAYTASVENPDDATPGELILDVDTDAERPYVSYVLKIDNCNDTIVQTTRIVPAGPTFLFTRNDDVEDMETGGYYRTLRIASTTAGLITIPLAPAGTDQATYTGVGGTTNATELTFNHTAPSIFANAIRIAILNYLGTLGYTQGTHFNLIGVSIDTTATRIGRVFKISMGCKHNPSSEWLGMRQADTRLQYIKEPGGTLLGYVASTRAGSSASQNETYSNSPCPRNADMLNFTVSAGVTSIADESTFDYDNITLNSSPRVASITGKYSHTCSSTLLTASAVNCVGALTYLWNTGEITPTTNQQQGTYTVTVSCSSPSSSDDASVTL